MYVLLKRNPDFVYHGTVKIDGIFDNFAVKIAWNKSFLFSVNVFNLFLIDLVSYPPRAEGLVNMDIL